MCYSATVLQFELGDVIFLRGDLGKMNCNNCSAVANAPSCRDNVILIRELEDECRYF